MEELTMALLYLSRFTEKARFEEDALSKSWKGYDWDVLDQLDEENYIDKRSPKSKSVYLTTEGMDYAKQILAKYGIQDWNEK